MNPVAYRRDAAVLRPDAIFLPAYDAVIKPHAISPDELCAVAIWPPLVFNSGLMGRVRIMGGLLVTVVAHRGGRTSPGCT